MERKRKFGLQALQAQLLLIYCNYKLLDFVQNYFNDEETTRSLDCRPKLFFKLVFWTGVARDDFARVKSTAFCRGLQQTISLQTNNNLS